MYVVINIVVYFKSTRKTLYSERSEEKKNGKVVESFYTFLTTPDEREKYVEKSLEAKIMM